MRTPRSRPRQRAVTALSASAVVAALLTGCGPDSQPEDTSRPSVPSAATRTASADDRATADDELAVSEVTTGITSPWGVVELDGGDLVVNERDTGRILRVERSSGETTELRTLPGVVPGGEAGLLGLVMTPDQDAMLAYYTTTEDSRVVSMSWDGTDLGEPEVLFDQIPTGAGYHQGGRMVIGPDDLVYIGTGDNGVPENAQDTDSLSGKVLRITLEGEPAPDNPFGNAVYSYGHRNVEGLTFDDRGRLWSAEFGSSEWDEVNLVEAGSNYGWPVLEGSGGGEDYVDPAAVWRTADASPSGITTWDGSLWLAALRGATLWEIPLVDGEDTLGQPVAHVAGDYGRLRTVLPSMEGGLLLTTSNTDGRGDVRDGDDRVLSLTR